MFRFCTDEAVVVTENRRGFAHQGARRGQLAQRFHAKRPEQHRPQSRRRDPRRRDRFEGRGRGRSAGPQAETQGSSAPGRSTLGTRRLHAQDHLYHRKCTKGNTGISFIIVYDKSDARSGSRGCIAARPLAQSSSLKSLQRELAIYGVII